MKIKVFKTAIWIICIIVLSGIAKLITYQVDMYYSNIAAKQFEDDAAYTALRTHGAITGIAIIVYALMLIFCLYRITRIWFKQKTTSK